MQLIKVVSYVCLAAKMRFYCENDYKWTSESQKCFGTEIKGVACPVKLNQI